MLKLRIDSADGESFEHLVSGDELTVGRSSTADLSLPDRFLSRLHARFAHRGDAWEVEDLGSRNGTFLNGERLTRAAAVSVGDEIRVSGCALRVLPEAGDSRVDTSTEWGASIFMSASDLLANDSAVVSEDSPDALLERASRLRLLNEVHQALSTPISQDDLLQLILSSAFDQIKPEEGAIFLKHEDGTYERAASRTGEEDTREHLYSETLLREVGDKGLAALVLDAGTDERFRDAQSILTSGVRSLVAAPLIDQEGSLGLIALSSSLHRKQFTEDDMALLTSLASVAAMRIRNLALAVQAAERKQLAQELELARKIQVGLLPSELPQVEGYELVGRNLPSRGVSGDFFEIVDRGGDCFVLVADVSGKGIAASLLTASLEALAAGLIEDGRAPDEVCGFVSSKLFQRTPPAKYATAWLGALDPASGELRYVNAGHNPALLVRASGEIEELGSNGFPVGLVETAEYSTASANLDPGDRLVVYTDGITEATEREDADEEFGTERLAEACRQNLEAAVEDLADTIEATLEEFTGGKPAEDDRTLVIVHRS